MYVVHDTFVYVYTGVLDVTPCSLEAVIQRKGKGKTASIYAVKEGDRVRGAFNLYGLLKKRLLRPCNRGVSVVKNVYAYRMITLRNDCIFSFLW